MKADILIKNGRVIDPAQNIDRVMDIAVSNGVIVDAAEVTSAAEVKDAAGCIVTPGLIDMHSHFASWVSEFAAYPEATYFPTGVTTAVDGGTCGTAMFPVLRAQMATSPLNMKAMLHCSVMGIPTIRYHENHNPACFDEDGMKKTVDQNRDRIVAVKVRMSCDVVEPFGVEPLARAKEISQNVGLPLACHTTNPPVPYGELAKYFDEGDIMIHIFHGVGHTIIGEDGKVLPEMWEAKRRGVVFDCACGRVHLRHAVAKKAIAEGFLPDVIATDIGRVSAFTTKKCYSLPFQMSRFLALGMELGDIVAAVTTNPARVIGENDRGTLKIGTVADIAVHRPVAKKTTFLDDVDAPLEGDTLLKTEMTVCGGDIVFCQIDF